MRGKRVSAQTNKIDLVIVSARYTAEGQVGCVQAYQRSGVVWGDVTLLTREQLLARLKAGARVVTGRTSDLPGDYQIEAEVRLTRSNGMERLALRGREAEGEVLGVPLF
jgi:hypothetical protein